MILFNISLILFIKAKINLKLITNLILIKIKLKILKKKLI